MSRPTFLLRPGCHIWTTDFINFQNPLCPLSPKEGQRVARHRISSEILPTLTEAEAQEKGVHTPVEEKPLISPGGGAGSRQQGSEGAHRAPGSWADGVQNSRARISLNAPAQQLRARKTLPAGFHLAWAPSRGQETLISTYSSRSCGEKFSLEPVKDQEKKGESEMTGRKGCKLGPLPLSGS